MASKRIVVMVVLTVTVFAIAICSQVIAVQPVKDNVPPPGFRALFNGKDFTGWKVPVGDNGHWKIIAGVIDYDAESEASGDKSLWHTEDFKDFVLHVDWRIKETPYVNPRIPYILPDGTPVKDIPGDAGPDAPGPTGPFQEVSAGKRLKSNSAK